MRVFLAITCGVLILWNQTPVVCAEGVSVGRDGVKLTGFGDVDADETVEHWSKRAEQDITTTLNLQIELLSEACELDDATVDKLRNAAKAVTARRIAAGRTQLRKFLYDSSLVSGDEAQDSRKPNAADVWRPYSAGNLRNGIVEFKGEFSKPLLEHPLWAGVMRTSLSEQQMKRLNTFQEKRNTSLLSTAISISIAEMDQEIFLSDDQTKQIHQHAMKSLVGEVTPTNPSSQRQANSITRSFFKEIDGLQEFLRPAQLQRLRFSDNNRIKTSVGWGSPSR